MAVVLRRRCGDVRSISDAFQVRIFAHGGCVPFQLPVPKYSSRKRAISEGTLLNPFLSKKQLTLGLTQTNNTSMSTSFRNHSYRLSENRNIFQMQNCTMWAASNWGFSETTIQPARHECQACCPLQAEKAGLQPAVGNKHGTHIAQVVSSLQKILWGSKLTWYTILTLIDLVLLIKRIQF